MIIIVKIPDEPKLEVQCRPTDTLLAIKDKIFTAFGLFANFYKLYFEGSVLDNNVKMLQEYGIVQGSVIELVRWSDASEIAQKKFFRLTMDFWMKTFNRLLHKFNVFSSPLCFRELFTQKLFRSLLFVAMCLCILCVAFFLSLFTIQNTTE